MFTRMNIVLHKHDTELKKTNSWPQLDLNEYWTPAGKMKPTRLIFFALNSL